MLGAYSDDVVAIDLHTHAILDQPWPSNHLTTDITNSDTPYCINIPTNLIDGEDAAEDVVNYGIYLKEHSEENTFRNNTKKTTTPTHAIDWYDEFNSKYPSDIPYSSSLGWGEAYIIRAYISMYRASKARGEPQNEREKWIERLINHCDYVVDTNLTGEKYLVWAGHGYTPIARFVKIIFEDDDLYSLHKDKANKYLYYIESEIIPHWRYHPIDSDWWNTPHNWYLSYGTLLLNLHQITRLSHYQPPDYYTPNSSLKDYYFNTVTDMATNHFQDFENWEYAGPKWYYPPHPEKKGLCYDPSRDAYAWRYYDHTSTLFFLGYDAEGNRQRLYNDKSVEPDKWYYVVILYGNNTLTMEFYDSDGVSLINRRSTEWDQIPTNLNFIIGKRIDGEQYFKGVMDEIKIEKGEELITYWAMEGNASDSSGNGHDGTINGTPNWVEGKVGQALSFDGDDYIIIPHHEELDNFTRIELWIKFVEFSAEYYLLGKGPDGGPGGYHLYMDCYERPEDVGHANLDIEFVIKAFHDPVFSQAYSTEMMNRFCNTFLEVVWENSNTTHPAFFSHVDPANQFGWHNHSYHTLRWLWLYEFEPQIGELVSNWYEDHPSYWFSEVLANLACWQEGLFEDDYNTTPDTHPPATITNLTTEAKADTWIYWTWTNPSEDFHHVEIYINCEWKVNTSYDYYNATGLNRSTAYNIFIRTVDAAGNINTTWVNDIETTLTDSTPPTVTLVAPSDNSTWTTSNFVNFIFNVTDESDIANCTLYIKKSTDNGTYLIDRSLLANLPITCDNVFTHNNGTHIFGICGAEDDTPVNYTFRYNIATKTVTNTTEKPLITDREVCAWNGTIFACVGGVDSSNWLNDSYRWNPETDSMTQNSDEQFPYRMMRAKACSNGSHVWMMGGDSYDAGGAPQNTIYRWNLVAKTFTDTGNTMPNKGYRYALPIDMGINDERFFIIGGSNGSVMNKVVLFNKTNETASEIAIMPLQLYGPVGFLAGDWIYYGGGLSATGVWNHNWFRFNINTYEVENLTGTMSVPRATAGNEWLPDKKYAVLIGGTYGPSGYPVTPNITKIQIYELLTNTTTNPDKNVNLSLSYTLDNGDYYWSIKCIDAHNNVGASEEWNVNVNHTADTTPTNINISLFTGWNLISTPLKPANTSIESVLSNLTGRVIVTTYNTSADEWYIHDSNSSETPTLDEIVAGRGYWLCLESDQNLTITGYPTGKGVGLYRGWNLVGYNSLNPDTASSVLSNLNDTVVLLTYDTELNDWAVYNSGGINYLNTLILMNPGRGYWLYSDINQTLILII